MQSSPALSLPPSETMTINDPEGYPVAIALGIASTVGALRLWVYVGAAGQALQFYMLGSSRALESSEVSQV